MGNDLKNKLQAAHKALREAQLESEYKEDYSKLDDLMHSVVDLYETRFGDFEP